MTFRQLIVRSLRFHWRTHLGVILGAALGSAALVGALLVGDSVRGSLRDHALERLGWIDAAMDTGDRTVSVLGRTTPGPRSVPTDELLQLPGTATRQDNTARANQVRVMGVEPSFWPGFAAPGKTNSLQPGEVLLNPALAGQLKAQAGDDLILRIHKPSALSRDVPISPQADNSIALRVKVAGLAPPAQLGNLSLRPEPLPPLNAFVDASFLAKAAGLDLRRNLILVRTNSQDGNDPVWRQQGILARLLGWIVKPKARPPGEPWDPVRYGDQLVLAQGSLANFSIELKPLTNSQYIELHSTRIFLDPPVVTATRGISTNLLAEIRSMKVPNLQRNIVSDDLRTVFQVMTNGRGILTYLVNQLRSGTNMTPYSMVTAAGAPWTPADLADDEIVINQWLADDLNLKPGDPVDLAYFTADSAVQLAERTNRFRVHSIVPLAGVHADRTLMPEFPGIAKAESTDEWDAGFPLVHKIRPKDDQYWKLHRGTPKAFISLAAGQRLWGNRFGQLTAIRWDRPGSLQSESFRELLSLNLQHNINPADLGLKFQPVRAQALAASQGSQDFGQLFLSFSFFLILAALILMALMFQFGLEQRAVEVGTLLALGWSPGRVRRCLLNEAVWLAVIGALIGVAGGQWYARALIAGLTSRWRDAVGGISLSYHATSTTLLAGFVAAVLVALVTIWIVLRRQARRPARELLAGLAQDTQTGAPVDDTAGGRKRGWLSARNIGWACFVLGLALVGGAIASGNARNPGWFFGAGFLCLVAALLGLHHWIARFVRGPGGPLEFNGLCLRSLARRRSRSVATAALLACGAFLVIAVGANRLDADRDAGNPKSGTGGFAFLGETTLPVIKDLNTDAGLEALGLESRDLPGTSFVPFRVVAGDDASCLNLNQTQRPRLLGVRPELLTRRDAFSFAGAAKGFDRSRGWSLLTDALPAVASTNGGASIPVIPVIGDANSIQWAMHRALGDELELTDERGQPFRLKLVASLANSILQGSLLVDEAQLIQRFPGLSGYRMFLINTPSNATTTVAATLSRAMQDVGLQLTPAAARLAQFNAVQNTYLNTFQLLGGLGLLLGSAGLGIVVLRNVLERRGELALLTAVGFTPGRLNRLVLAEHLLLLAMGLAAGTAAALIAVVPALLPPGGGLPVGSLTVTVTGVVLLGAVSTVLATRIALRGRLIDNLRID